MRLKLSNPVGASYPTEAQDVIGLKRVLSQLNFYALPDFGITPYGDMEMFDAVKEYQSKRRLIIDGVLTPGGETERDLNRTLNEIDISARSPSYRCTNCGGWHGGTFGRLCYWCWKKLT
jgi:hypothetical protein